VIKVSDDGAGMDRDAIRRKAIERGLMRPDAQLSDRDLFAFISETGFSTAEQVTKIAGRGVGMDVVASEIKQLGGSLSIDSQRGLGSQINIRLPFTLAVTQAIMVRLGDSVFAVPMSSVQGVARIKREDLFRRLQQPVPSFGYAGDEYLIHELDHLLGLVLHRASDESMLPLLLTRTGDQRAAIRVDAVLGSREIVVKSVGPQLASVPGIFGATIMGDGSVVMILDVAPLVRRAAALREEVAREAELEAMLPGLVSPIEAPSMPLPEPVVEVRRQPLIMVVDDSITMRKVTTRVLERNDMEVVTAKDGLDAVEKLQDRVPDLVLLDIEMPRMDGYELATYMRNDSRLKLVPIIMITSRTGEKHRQRAFEIGVDRYLGKPYQEADLLRNVEETLRLSRAIH
jgi:chemosensory pili system protein ChpA (sensor histidine kinase/response regulator)